MQDLERTLLGVLGSLASCGRPLNIKPAAIQTEKYRTVGVQAGWYIPFVHGMSELGKNYGIMP